MERVGKTEPHHGGNRPRQPSCRISSGVLVSQSVKRAKSMERVGKTEIGHGSSRAHTSHQ